MSERKIHALQIGCIVGVDFCETMENNTADQNTQPVTPNRAEESFHTPDGQRVTYKEYGFQQSILHNASPVSLQVELRKINETYLQELRKDEATQEKLKDPIRRRMEGLKVDLELQQEHWKAQKEDRIPGLKARIEALNDEIATLRRNREVHRDEQPNRISFIIGITVLTILTIYLWIFYTSAGYSAFFRDFEAGDIKVANSIFDAKAIVKAWNDGVPAFVLVCSMPFIFLALGYLIHKCLLQRHWTKWLYLLGLIAVTFCFDYIIAYEIVSKIHELKRAASLDNLPAYNMSMAFVDINFWLIIFAGFVTYLIWGFLFDRLMEEYERFDVVKQRILAIRKEIEEQEKMLAAEEGRLKAMRDDIANIQKQIKYCEDELGAIFLDPKNFEHIIYQFASGWIRYIEGGQPGTQIEKENRRNECRVVVEQFIAAHKARKTHETEA